MLDTTSSAAVEWERVGRALLAGRESRGMSLPELSQRTRIKAPLLEALEQGEVEKLPRGPCRRGFARAYAVEVGLDAERLLAHFASEAVPVDAPPPPPFSEPPLASREFLGRLLVSAALVAVAIIVPRWIIHSNQDAPVVAGFDSVGTAGVQPANGAPPPPTNVQPGPQAAAAAPAGTITVVLRAVDEVWIQADVDGQRVAYELLTAGTQKTFTARTALSLRVGDAGAVEYTVNGVSGAPLGPRGFVRDLHLSAPPPQ